MTSAVLVTSGPDDGTPDPVAVEADDGTADSAAEVAGRLESVLVQSQSSIVNVVASVTV